MKPVHKDFKEFFPKLDLSKVNIKGKKINSELKVNKDEVDKKFLEEMLTKNELLDILEKVNLSMEEFIKFSYNKTAIKLIKIFEILLKLNQKKIEENTKLDSDLNKKSSDFTLLNKKFYELLQENNNIKMKIKSDFKNFPSKPNLNNIVDDFNDNSMVVNNISIIQNESNIVYIEYNFRNNFNEFNINIKKEIEDAEFNDKIKKNESESFMDIVELKINDDVVSDIKNNRKGQGKSVKKTKNYIDINMMANNSFDIMNNTTNLVTSSTKLNKFLENMNKNQNIQFLNEKKNNFIK